MDVPLLLRVLCIVPLYQVAGSERSASFPELVQTENDAIAPWYLSAGVQSRPNRPASSEHMAPQGYYPGHLVEHTPSHRAIESTNPLPHMGSPSEGSSRRIASAAQEASTELIDAIRGALDKFRETLNRSDVHDDMRQVGSQLESTWNELRKGAWVERAFAELATLSDATSSERQKIAEGSFNEAIRQRLEDFRNRIVQEQTRLNSVIENHSSKSVPSVSEGASSRERHNRGLHRIQLR